MTPADFEFLRQYLKQRSGLILAEDKGYLVESRLGPVARKRGFKSIVELAAKLKVGNDSALEREVVEAMTTNESFFFRDKTPFENFKDVMMPELFKSRAGSKKLRMWCAAASTGQEPYSLAMIWNDMARETASWKLELLGTDLATDVLERAKSGGYSQFEVQRGLPIQMLMKYFKQVGDQWQISDQIKQMVQYRPLNLLRDFSSLGQFDVVFCRNVLIYFDQATKKDILERIAKQMAPDGYLVMGAAETIVGLTNALKPHPEKRGIYIPNTASAEVVRPRFAIGGQ